MYDNYLTIVSCLIVVTVALLIASYAFGADWRPLLAVAGGLISFVYFVQKQQLEEAKLAKELISDFNSRYNNLNESLNTIVGLEKEEKRLTIKEREKLFDYFNLCAEEYLFYRRGYIYPEVWQSWTNGMKPFFEDPRVMELWGEEEKTSSYYGLNTDKEFRHTIESALKEQIEDKKSS